MTYFFSACTPTGINFSRLLVFKNLCLLALFVLITSLTFAQTKAFPSAYGAGAYTTGGRGGDVYHVTNLNDSGSGSFREALKQSNRTIVFDVSGIIQLKSLLATSVDNITIAGQTAPEGGITIDGSRVYFSGVDNIIVRHIRFKGGVDYGDDSFTAASSMTNIIFDHCTFAFGADESASFYTTEAGSTIKNITVQRSLFSESKNGSIFGGYAEREMTVGQISVINNMYYNASHRFPNIAGNDGEFEVINNVIWTVKNRLIRGDGEFKLNHINNYYDYGVRPLQDTRIQCYTYKDGTIPAIYTSGNKYVAVNSQSPTNSVSELNANNKLAWKFFLDGGGYARGDQIPDNYFVNNQYGLFGAKMSIQSADAAFNDVKFDVGCNARLNADGSSSSNLDLLDTEWLTNVQKGIYTERLETSAYKVPAFTSKTRPSDYDTDQDGMADEWERKTFGNLNKDGLGDADGDGYTDLEEFLNGVDEGNSQDIIPSLEVIAGEDETICNGAEITLTASGASSYLWSTGDTTASITVSPENTTTYTVTGEDSYGNSDTDEVLITVVDLTSVDAGEDVTVCEDGSIELRATGAGEFEWSTGEKTQSITVSPNKTTTYTVTATNGICSNSDEVTVTVSPRQTINAGSDVNIELGESTTLSVSGSGSVLWSTGEITRDITVSPTVSTTYTVTVSENGCEAQDEVTVVVSETVVEVIADAGDNETICEGETVTLTASGGSTYKWSTGATTQSITVSPSTTTTYSVEVFEGAVSATATVTVQVYALPVANAGADQTIEEGESITLTASGGSTYSWSNGSTSQSITVSPNQTTTYTVEVSNENGCSDSDAVQVIVNAKKVEVIADAGEDQAICEGETVTLTASGGSTYKWSTGATTQSITVSPSTTTTYSVEVFEGAVSATDEVTVQVYALPVANAGADQTIEAGESITLTASGGSTYNWSNGSTSQSITVSPNETTTYTVEVSNENGCSDSDAVQVIVNAKKVEVIADAGEDQAICEGETVTLTASGGSTYKWSTGATTQSITVSPSTTTTYSVEVFEGDVSATATVTVQVYALPVANAGADQTIEAGESITLTASGGSTYSWSNGSTSQSITVSPNQTTTYTVEVSNENGCSDSDAVQVIVKAKKVEVIADAGEDQAICEGETVTLTASGGSTYKWSTGATTQSITVSPSTTTTYSVEVFEGAVSATATVTVRVYALPIANAGADQTIEEGESITLTASGGTEFLWSNGSTSRSITVSPNQTTLYSVAVFNELGCYTEDEVVVIVEAFKGEEIEEEIEFEFNIYPNPTSELLNLKISGLDQAIPVRIYDMSGKVLYNNIIESDGSLRHEVLNLSSYPKGFYVLSIIKAGNTITKKIVVK
ncbi:T9SS type A sorting domain-containing protein [Formosa sediminum]|uniref:T9SS type A sorting domain-containing protein n=1 Tax=Formosa sediminum TaxID=2594004 RepID=A0A516GS26_9FLAO|nr:T9SS type A sorting domain-containing protein [Formosa sediminum]QDO94316.1 T9SS type A sorting domain-containing protein [Formosa sediminum]